MLRSLLRSCTKVLREDKNAVNEHIKFFKAVKILCEKLLIFVFYTDSNFYLYYVRVLGVFIDCLRSCFRNETTPYFCFKTLTIKLQYGIINCYNRYSVVKCILFRKVDCNITQKKGGYFVEYDKN